MQTRLSNGNYIQLEKFDDGATTVIGIGPNLRDMTFTDMTQGEVYGLWVDLLAAIE